MNLRETARELLQEHATSPGKTYLYARIVNVILSDLNSPTPGMLGSDLLGQLWQASYDVETSSEGIRNFILERAGEVYPVEAFLCVPWRDASEAALWKVLPQSDILQRIVMDQSFTGTVAELLEMVALLKEE